MILAIYALVGILSAVQFQGPAVRDSESEPENSVSAFRAREELLKLLGPEELIHEAGSIANEVLRNRLIRRLKELELEPFELPFEVEDRKMVNLLARRPGTPTHRPILIASHYDSCITGPGASDALACVAAILESVRAIQANGSGPEFWILFTDGEEGGLLGARSFVELNLPWGESKPFVINLDARGTTGAASMFETNPNNYGYVQRLKGSLASPRFSSSLMANVYELLPNKTDFTIFKELDWPGLNFAIIGGAHRYHTLEDTPNNLSDRSLQHFADHAHQLLTELLKWKEADWSHADNAGSAVFFDLLGTYVCCYSSYLNPVLSLGCWILFGMVMMRFQGIVRIRLKYIASLFTAVLTIVLIGLLAGSGFSRLLKMLLAGRKYVEFGEIGALGYTFFGIFLCTTLGAWAFRQRNLYHARLASLFALSLLATFCSFRFPGAAYLFQLPALFWSLLLLIRPTKRWIDYLAFTLFSILHAPLIALLPIAIGPLGGMILSGASILLLFPLLVLYSEFPTTKYFDLEPDSMQKDRLE